MAARSSWWGCVMRWRNLCRGGVRPCGGGQGGGCTGDLAAGGAAWRGRVDTHHQEVDLQCEEAPPGCSWSRPQSPPQGLRREQRWAKSRGGGALWSSPVELLHQGDPLFRGGAREEHSLLLAPLGSHSPLLQHQCAAKEASPHLPCTHHCCPWGLSRDGERGGHSNPEVPGCSVWGPWSLAGAEKGPGWLPTLASAVSPGTWGARTGFPAAGPVRGGGACGPGLF